MTITNISNTSKNESQPILYTFRRCPYAMRARLAVVLSGVKVEYREILLKDKPESMLEASPKATVPVLIVKGEPVIDESLDIMFWALLHSDPKNILDISTLNRAKKLICINDLEFKPKLDLYKYAARFPEKSELEYRDECDTFLQKLNILLMQNKYLFGNNLTIADIAIFPFIRQFALVNKTWFDSIKYHYLRDWLNENIGSELFKQIMVKKEIWSD